MRAIRSLLVGLLVLLAPGALAQSVTEVLDGLPDIAGARQISERQQTVSGYRLVFSGLKRQSASTFGERELRISGQLWRQAWEADERLDPDDISNRMLSYLPDGTLMYRCQDLDCGSSHFWANEIFSNGRLVGRETKQAYFVLQVPQLSDDGRSLNAVYLFYATQRGSRQTVWGLDVIVTDDSLAPDTVTTADVESALSNSSGWLPGFVVRDGRLDEDASQILINTLKSQSQGVKRRLFLIVHCYQDSHMEANQACSDRLADQLRSATFDNRASLQVVSQGALALPPGPAVEPALRFVFWPRR